MTTFDVPCFSIYRDLGNATPASRDYIRNCTAIWGSQVLDLSPHFEIILDHVIVELVQDIAGHLRFWKALWHFEGFRLPRYLCELVERLLPFAEELAFKFQLIDNKLYIHFLAHMEFL